jgi:hypothetical protein
MAKQSHFVGHVNKNANKKRRKLITRDHAIASVIIEFSNFVNFFEKLKLQMMERITSQILERENKARR